MIDVGVVTAVVAGARTFPFIPGQQTSLADAFLNVP